MICHGVSNALICSFLLGCTRRQCELYNSRFVKSAALSWGGALEREFYVLLVRYIKSNGEYSNILEHLEYLANQNRGVACV